MHSFRWHTRLFIKAIAFVASFWLCPCDTASADWKELFSTEAPPKWAAMEQYYANMEASFRKIFAMPTEGKPLDQSFIGTIYLDLRINGDKMVYTAHKVGKDSSGKDEDITSVRGVNSRYVFELAKATPDASTFLLAKFEPVSETERQKVLNGLGDEYRAAFAGSQFGRLSDIIKDPRFTITNILGKQREGKVVVQFEYDVKLETPETQAPSQPKQPWTEHGIVELDPQHFWCILRTHFDNQNWIGDETVEYGEDMDGFPIPRRRTSTSTHKKGLGTGLVIFEFDKFVHRDIPESEFTLSAFGLPEVQVPGEQKPNTVWRWLIGIGIALGVLAVLIRFYVKRKNRQVPQSV